MGPEAMSARSKESKLKMIGGAGLLCLAVGYAISPAVPVIMKIWTTSYGLVSAGWACLVFMLFYWVIDFRGNRKWALPFVVIGSNAIFIYMFTSLIPLGTWVHIFTRQMTGEWANLEPLLSAVLALAVEWFILFWMYKRKIFIKV